MEHVEQFIRSGTYLRAWSPRTVRTYRQAFTSLQQCPRATPEEGSLTKARLEAWVAWLRQKGVSPGGVNMYVRTVNSYLAWKHEEGLSPERLRLRLLPNPPRPLRAISDAEVRLLLAHRPACRNEQRAMALSALLLDTGLRIEEALGLELAKVDFDGMVVRALGKGNKERIVPFSHDCRKLLYRHCSDQEGVFVFGTRSGHRLSYRNAYRDIKDLFAKAGVEGRHIHPHALRHCFAVTYVRRGGDIYRLSRILGHSSISTTQLYLRSMGLEHLREGHSRLSPLSRA